jgi:hypothetical protein
MLATCLPSQLHEGVGLGEQKDERETSVEGEPTLHLPRGTQGGKI